MDKQEFCASQVSQIERDLMWTRQQIEALMQREEYLVAQRDKWYNLGAVALAQLIPPPRAGERPHLTLIRGGAPDGAA